MGGDLDLHFGGHEAVARVYRGLAVEEPTWENLCRLANLETQLGRLEAALALYARAAEEITAKEMRAFAWLQVQWGDTELALGKPARARRRYAAAHPAYSRDLLVHARIA